MGCLYENNMVGHEDCGWCGLCDDKYPFDGPQGSEKGFCVVSDDPDPADSCPDYESDNVCGFCGVDMNVDECKCEDEDDRPGCC